MGSKYMNELSNSASYGSVDGEGISKKLFVEVMLQSIHHCQKLIVCDILAFVVFYRMMLVKGERSSLVFGD